MQDTDRQNDGTPPPSSPTLVLPASRTPLLIEWHRVGLSDNEDEDEDEVVLISHRTAGQATDSPPARPSQQAVVEGEYESQLNNLPLREYEEPPRRVSTPKEDVPRSPLVGLLSPAAASDETLPLPMDESTSSAPPSPGPYLSQLDQAPPDEAMASTIPVARDSLAHSTSADMNVPATDDSSPVEEAASNNEAPQQQPLPTSPSYRHRGSEVAVIIEAQSPSRPRPPKEIPRRLSSSSSSSSDLTPPPSATLAGPSTSSNNLAGPSTVPMQSDEAAARAAAMLPPSPPRRNLRARKAQQLNPYTLEALRYQRALVRNDWEDAVVSQREWARQEKRRLREEAAKTAAEGGANGESQSQWLEPDPEDEAQEESWRKEEEREQKRREKEQQRAARRAAKGKSPTKKAAAAESSRQGATAGGSAGPSSRLLLSSDTETETEDEAATGGGTGLVEPTAGPSRPRAGVSHGPTTYGKRANKGRPPLDTAIHSVDDAAAPRARSAEPSSSSSSPVLGPRRQHARVRSMSNIELASSDAEPDVRIATPQTAQTPVRAASEARRSTSAIRIFDSSADEDEPPQRPGAGTSSSAKRRRRHGRADGGIASDSDSTDYERRFRQLKKMMPAGMARKHIEDLKAMRRGKAYHSDGHVSSTPEPSDNDGADTTVVAPTSTPSTSPLDATELRPGEARKRVRRRSLNDGEEGGGWSQLFPADSESENETTSAPSRASSSSDSDTDADVLRMWTERSRHRREREEDAIDRMLSRTNGDKRPAKRAHRSDPSRPRARPKQSRLDSHLMERPAQSRSHGEGSSRKSKVSGERSASAAGAPTAAGVKRKRKKHDPRIGRVRSSHRGPAPRPANPAVVRPRTRPRLDLINDDVLFDFELDRILGGGPTSEEPDDDIMTMLGDPSAAPRSPSAALAQGPASGQGGRYLDGGAGPAIRGGGVVGVAKPLQRTVSNSSRRQNDGTDAGHHTHSPLRALNNLPMSPAPPQRFEHLQQHRMTTPQAKSPGSDRRPVLDTSSPVKRSPNTAANAAAHMDAQRAEAEAWDDHEGLRIDFGIRPLPAGPGFASSTYLGRGRLHELLHLPDNMDVPDKALPPGWTSMSVRVGQVDLDAMMSADELCERLPSLFEALAQQADTTDAACAEDIGEMCKEKRRPAATELDDTARLLCLRLTAEACNQLEPDASVARLYRTITNQVDLLFQRLRKRTQPPLELMLRLLWLRVELCWRMLAAFGQDTAAFPLHSHELASMHELMSCSKVLMLLLLRHGLHRTMRAVKAFAMPHEHHDDDEEAHTAAEDHHGANRKLTDTSAELWVCLIHLLEEAGRLQQDALGEAVSFWPVFKSTLALWQGGDAKKRTVVVAESTWYCILSLGVLSRFSASTGAALPTCRIGEHWPLVVRALATVRLRFDEAVEASMSLPALNKRDQYIRVLLRRCLDLDAVWGWRMEGAELTLSRLFEVFDSHQLIDLPSESDHDFPSFLREFDDRLLYDDVHRDDTCFHIFIKLVARAGRHLRASAVDERDADRKVSRLFSRISPVRSMGFTRTNVPTSRQRSMLFNHYTLVMLFLYLVPSQAAQRLRQIKSFLASFKQADFASQLACVRAMMYAAVVFQHHALDVSPISAWFGEVTTTMMREYETLERTTGTQRRRPDAPPLAPVFEEAQARQVALRRQGEVARLIVAVLRSLQHVIQHPTLDRRAHAEGKQPPAYPDIKLLHASWTKDILEAQLAVDPAIGHEALKCIHTFLLQRNAAVAAARSKTSKTTGPGEGAATSTTAVAAAGNSNESQDSFGDLFDDNEFDFADPTLDDLLGGGGGAGGGGVEQPPPHAPAPAPAPANGGEENSAEFLRRIKEQDRAFAEYANSVISPALFRLLSNLYHPDRRASGQSISLSLPSTAFHCTTSTAATAAAAAAGGTSRAQRRSHLSHLLKLAERRRYLESIVDSWAGCAAVLVSTGLRSWTSYLGFGNESWKRIDDAVGKRDVALRFVVTMLTLDASAWEVYEGEVVAVWCSSVVAARLSVQHALTARLAEVSHSGGGGGGLCSGWREVLARHSFSSSSSTSTSTSSPNAEAQQQHGSTTTTTTTPTLTLETFATIRLDLLTSLLDAINIEARTSTRRLPCLIGCLSALLSSVRVYIDDLPVRPSSVGASDGRKEYEEEEEEEEGEETAYLNFSRRIVAEIEKRTPPVLMRGVRGEVALTSAAIQRRRRP